MAQFGWFLSFKQPEDWEKLPTNEERLSALASNIKHCFEQVEPLLVNGLRFASKQELVGTACVVGPESECLRLKQQIEEMGIGQMLPNTDCIRLVQ